MPAIELLLGDLSDAKPVTTGAVYGRCCLRVSQELYFPHRDWTDFVVVVLDWWAAAVARVLLRGSEIVEVRFMEGPYAVEISTSADLRNINFACMQTAPPSVVAQGATPAGAFAETLLDSIDQVLAVCQENDLSARDADHLRATSDVLRSAISRWRAFTAPS